MSENEPISQPNNLSLRRRAEDVLKPEVELLPEMPDEVVRKVVHELRTHQLELEMQNEELRHSQEELLHAHERLTELYDFAPIAYFTLTPKSLILEANITAAKMLGIDRDLLIKRRFSSFIVDEDRDAFFMYRQKVADSDKSIPCDLRVRNLNGETIWASLQSSPVLGEMDDGPRDMRVAIMDVTEIRESRELARAALEEKRQIEKQVLETQKLESLGVMAGGIAHDFNNILAIILGYIDLARKEMPAASAGRTYLDEIQISATRAEELTNQMLAYSGNTVMATEKMDLSGMVEEMARLLEVSHAKKALLSYDFAKKIPAIMGDGSQLRQVVMNLITNASDAVGSGGGLITVKTGTTDISQEFLETTYAHDDATGGRYVYLEVTDTGCGMDAETQRRLFEPFFTTKFAGRGLGMAAVLGIIRAHKGAISIDSAVGRGTTIRMLLPALDEPLSPPAIQPEPVSDWLGKGTILVVDDEEQIRTLSTLLLERKGFTVLTAQDGREAVGLYEENKDEILCVILDLTMPHMGGAETFNALRQIREDVRVILISGYSEDELLKRVSPENFAGFLKKPMKPDILLNKIRSVLGL